MAGGEGDGGIVAAVARVLPAEAPRAGAGVQADRRSLAAGGAALKFLDAGVCEVG